MQRLETRIAALEGNMKRNQPSSRLAAEVVDSVREILSPLGLEVPDALPGELFSDWLKRLTDEALSAIVHAPILGRSQNAHRGDSRQREVG